METGRDKTQIGRRAVTRRAAAWAAALVALTGCFLPTSKVYAADEYGSGWYFDDTSGSYGDTGRLTISTDEGMSKFNIKSASSRVRYIIIEDGVTSIPDRKLNGAWSPYTGRYAKEITIAGSVKSIGEEAFYKTTSLQKLTLSEGLESIGYRAFAGSKLDEVTIPASVKSIGEKAFSCNISSVTMLSETPPALGEGAFDGAEFFYNEIGEHYGKKYGIFVPEGSVQAYREAWPAYKKYIYSPYPLGDEEKNLDPTQTDEDSDKPAYADTTIDVQAHTLDKVVYSVDVEWGAMTFRYENSIWDATAHQATTGAGWQVYDSVNDKAVDTTEDAINRIQVTNHSNAEVKAALAYAGQAGYEDTTGSFAKAADDNETSYDDTTKTLTLANADNNNGEAEGQGKATVGCVYFMPSGIKEDYKTAGITKWTQLGTITVGVETADQKEATD